MPLSQTAFLDKSLPHEIRFLAIILLKNGIEKYWRLTAPKNSIKPPEKHLIRSRLFQGSVDEEDRAFALHNALVIAKVVRIDYPNDWPDALQTLIDLVKSTRGGNQMHLHGALVIIHRVVKELSTARLRRSQTALQSATPGFVQLLGEIYTEKAAYWLEFLTKGRGDEDDADLAMQNSLTCLKILRPLLMVGYEYPHQDPTVQQFWSLSQSQFGQFLGYVSHDSPIPAPYQDVVGKHLLQFAKLHLQMCETHAASFSVLPDSIPLVRAYWDLVANFAEVFEKSGGIKQSAGEGHGAKSKLEGPLLERLALRGLLLLKCCIAIVFQPTQTFKYRSAEVKQQETEAINRVKTELLTNDFVLQVVNVIITRLFIFRQSDLDAWEEDPEEWEAQERDQGQAWEWEVRPCAERVLMHLLIHYKDLLSQPLLAYFEATTKEDSSIVTKEAVYTAMGCAAATIHELFDFNAFLASTLVRDAQVQDPLAKLLRRRIAILISQWVTIKISSANRPLVYEIFRHLMDPNDKINDQVVRITAARQLKLVADDFVFDGAAFLPFAADTFTRLINILGEVSLDETRLAILETIRVIVTRMETSISQFGDAIMALLPRLWDSAGNEEYMIKQSVLALASALVMAMRGDSQRYQSFMVPLLAEAMNPESALHLHLIEESVELWKSILNQSSPPLSEELMKLVQLALPLLEYDSEVTEGCMGVVKNYIILAPEAILRDDLRRPTLAAVIKALDSRSRGRIGLGTESIELIIRMGEFIGGTQGVSVVVQDLLELGFLRKVIEGLHGAWEDQQSVGPKKRATNQISNILEKEYFTLLARIALADPTVFVNMLASFGPGNAVQPVWEWLGSAWFSNFDGMADIDRQKLSCLALTRLCELPQPMEDLVLGKLQDYLSMWTSVVMSMRAGTESGAGDTLIWDGIQRYDYDTPVDILDREFAAKDPIHTMHTFDFVRARLQDLVRRVGGEQEFEARWAVNVDKEVLVGFQGLSEPRPAED